MILASDVALAAPGSTELPSGGTVVGGSATIASSGARLDINQTSGRAAIDWNTFNIGSDAHVHFQQPAGGVALNRVLASDASQIFGRLTSTGQVFLLNPQGIYFAPGAQVDVGGLVASTLNLSNVDFMAGNYAFQGGSSNAIINQGNITAASGGTLALIAAKITNDGTLTAPGGNVLLGAGSKVTLDMGGPVKLQIENSALETLIANGGAIRAAGGSIWRTSQAAATLASSVINNTGLIEAQALSTGAKGEVILFAHDGHMQVGGTIKADGGFVETSGKTFGVTSGASILAGQWLIDPVDITIDQALANIIQTSLGTGDVTISTAGGNTPDTSSGEVSTGSPRGDIHFNGNLTWSANTLVLRADNDIWIRGNLTGTGTAKLGLEYGQSSVGNSNNRTAYTILGAVSLPSLSLYTKFGTNGSTAFTSIPVFLNNGILRFGNGATNSIDSTGLLKQPFLYDSTANKWNKLTFDSIGLGVTLGVGGSGYADGTILFTPSGSGSFASTTVDSSGFSNGRGTLVATTSVTIAGSPVTMRNTYVLGAEKSFLKTTSAFINNDSVSLSNFRFWTGTRDDFIGINDEPDKTRGNLTSSGFVAITDTNDQAKALLITDGSAPDNPGVLFFSTLPTAQAAFSTASRTDNFSLFTPEGSGITVASTDRSYALFANYGTLAANGGTASMDWFYAGGSISALRTSVATSVNEAAAPSATTSSTPRETAIKTAQGQPVEVSTTGSTPQPVSGLASGLSYVEVDAAAAGGSAEGSGPASIPGSTDAGTRSSAGFMRVFVVGGGVNLPDQARDPAGLNLGGADDQNKNRGSQAQ